MHRVDQQSSHRATRFVVHTERIARFWLTALDHAQFCSEGGCGSLVSIQHTKMQGNTRGDKSAGLYGFGQWRHLDSQRMFRRIASSGKIQGQCQQLHGDIETINIITRKYSVCYLIKNIDEKCVFWFVRVCVDAKRQTRMKSKRQRMLDQRSLDAFGRVKTNHTHKMDNKNKIKGLHARRLIVQLQNGAVTPRE